MTYVYQKPEVPSQLPIIKESLVSRTPEPPRIIPLGTVTC